MKTPKFMQFDEAKFVQDYLKGFDHVGNSVGEIARYQHQRDLVVMKKLWEIVEIQKKALTYFMEDYDCEIEMLPDFHFRKAELTLAQVETMLKELDK